MTILNPHRNILSCIAFRGATPDDAVNDASEQVTFHQDQGWVAFGPPIKSNGVDTSGYAQFMVQYTNTVSQHYPWANRKQLQFQTLHETTSDLLAAAITTACGGTNWVPYSLVWVDSISTDYYIMLVKYEGVVVV